MWVTYHPASVLRGGYQYEERIVEDLKRSGLKVLQNPTKSDPTLDSSQFIGIDTEYSPDRNLLTLGFADVKRSISYETTGKDWIKKAKAILKKAKVITGHNLPGDLDYLVKNKIAKEAWLKGEQIQDSLLLARMVDENRGRGSYSLGTLMLSEFNFIPWKDETERLFKKDADASKWTVAQRTERCRLDAWASLVLAEHFRRKLNDSKRVN